MNTYEIWQIGTVLSELKNLTDCPFQNSENAPKAYLHINPAWHKALRGAEPGMKIVILTWLDKSNRSTLAVHPRKNRENPLTGVFFTRSPNRPNPVGLHETTITGIDEQGVIEVKELEVLNGTPIIDIKISLSEKRYM